MKQKQKKLTNKPIYTYMVYRNGRKAIKDSFPNYQKALQAARKRCRKLDEWGDVRYLTDSSNPTISVFGFTIKRKLVA